MSLILVFVFLIIFRIFSSLFRPFTITANAMLITELMLRSNPLFYLQGLFTLLGDYISSIQTSFSVQTTYIYDISTECQQSTVNPGNYISAKIEATNNGEYEDDVNIEWWIEDSAGAKYTSGSTVVNISTGHTWSSIKSLLVPSYADGGIYYFFANLSVDYYSALAYDTFEVIIIPPTTTTAAPPPGIIATTTTTIPEEIVELIKNLEITYPSNIFIPVGSTHTAKFRLKNAGNVTLRAMSLILEGVYLDWFSISPGMMTLLPGVQRTFEITFSIPDNATIKRYPISATITSEEIEKKVDLILNVVKVLDLRELEEKMTELERKIWILSERAEELEDEEAMKSIESVLKVSREKIALARIETINKKIDKASQLLYETEYLLDLAEATLEVAEEREVRYWATFKGLIGIVSAVVVFSIAVIAIKVKMMKVKKKAPKKVEKPKRVKAKKKR